MSDKMNKEIEHKYTDEIVCPFCGYEHGDSWERRDDEGIIECDGCKKPFLFSRDVSVSYSTEQIQQPTK